mmetsp:Transcript_28619/g.77208  ORF Transcript_28619/g.77208 Transcript_28619/m.77208 type:complete len:206 (-) Transcript_28619:480-1097(-)
MAWKRLARSSLLSMSPGCCSNSKVESRSWRSSGFSSRETMRSPGVKEPCTCGSGTICWEMRSDGSKASCETAVSCTTTPRLTTAFTVPSSICPATSTRLACNSLAARSLTTTVSFSNDTAVTATSMACPSKCLSIDSLVHCIFMAALPLPRRAMQLKGMKAWPYPNNVRISPPGLYPITRAVNVWWSCWLISMSWCMRFRMMALS